MEPPPISKRQSGTWLGNARGCAEKISCTSWSSTRLMPMVASRGAMRARPCSGRNPIRSITMPSNAHDRTTIRTVNGNGVFR